MEFNEIIKYLGENLHIQVEQGTEFGPVEMVRVKLLIGEVIVSEDFCYLPDND